MLPLHFAPLQGYTEKPYRNAHHKIVGNIAAYYSPFIRVEKGGVRSKDLRDISGGTDTKLPLIPQIIAADVPEFRLLAAAVKDLGYRRLDINMGCPFPMQTRKGHGAAILQYPEKVAAIMAEVSQLADIGISCSLKMRLGFSSEQEGLALLPILNKAPLSHITIHPRLSSDQYTGPLRTTAFDIFYRELERPLIFNGELRTISQVTALEEKYPRLAGIMVGRGLLENPLLSREYATGHGATVTEIQDCQLAIHKNILQYYEDTILGGPQQLLTKIRPFWDYAGAVFDHKFLKNIKKCRTLDEYCAICGTNL